MFRGTDTAYIHISIYLHGRRPILTKVTAFLARNFCNNDILFSSDQWTKLFNDSDNYVDDRNNNNNNNMKVSA